MNIKKIEYNPANWRRPDIIKEPQERWTIDRYWLGEDAKKEFIPFIVNLLGLIYDNNIPPTPYIRTTSRIEILPSSGIKKSEFTNAAGGIWRGYYRYFPVYDSTGKLYRVAIGISGNQKTVKDPYWGTRKGTTVLIVAVEHNNKGHHSLQLPMEKYICGSENKYKYSIWHNGTISRGKRKEVIKYVEQHSPKLITAESHEGRDEKWVELGTLDNTKLLTWEQEATQEFIGNLIEYALLRDEFRDNKDRLAQNI